MAIVPSPAKRARTLVLGLSGGLACGKTTVCGMLAERGAAILEADAVFAELQAPGSPSVRALAEELGPEVLDASGRLDVPSLARAVALRPGSDRRVGELLHRPAFEELVRRREALAGTGVPLLVVAVPLLFDALHRRSGPLSTLHFDATVCVVAPRALQLRRILARDGGSVAEAEVRLGRQLPAEEQPALADHVIDNGGTLHDTRRQVAALHARLLAAPGQKMES